MKRNIFLIGILFLILYLFLEPANALEASKNGLDLWLNTLLPTLLPFMILSNLLVHTQAIERMLTPLSFLWKWLLGLSPYGAYAYLLGMLCGYPMGAKLTGDLYGAGKITKKEASYLLTFCNNASPMFLSTYLVISILGRPDYILPTFAIVYSCNYLTSLCFRTHYRPGNSLPPMMAQESGQIKKETSSHAPKGNWIDVSIMNGIETITKLGGYILLFSIFSAALKNIWHTETIGSYAMFSLTEISTGLHQLKNAAISFPLKYAISVAATSFGGMCILAQTRSVIVQQGLPLSPYLAGKTLNLVLTFLTALIIAQII